MDTDAAMPPLTHHSNPSLAEVIERLTALATRKLDERGATDEYVLLSAALWHLMSAWAVSGTCEEAIEGCAPQGDDDVGACCSLSECLAVVTIDWLREHQETAEPRYPQLTKGIRCVLYLPRWDIEVVSRVGTPHSVGIHVAGRILWDMTCDDFATLLRILGEHDLRGATVIYQ